MDKVVSNIEYTRKVLKDLNRNHFKYEIRIAKAVINIAFVIDILAHLMLIIMDEYEYFTSNVIFGQIILLLIVVITNTNIFADISTYFFLRTDKLSLGLKSEMTFEENKVTVVNETENMTLGYDKLYKIIETKEYIYLYLNKQQALIVMKGNNSTVELAKLKDILKSNVKKYIEYIK